MFIHHFLLHSLCIKCFCVFIYRSFITVIIYITIFMNVLICPDLELHGDDVYFTLENSSQDVDQRQPGLAASSTTSSKVFILSS